MKRNIIKIDEEKCNGCGLCIPSCREGALKVINGKLRLVSDVYCDGLGACIGYCPQGAISIQIRKAEAFDEKKATANIIRKRLIEELEGYFGSDAKRINHAKKVLAAAEELLKTQDADRYIVIAASLLHDVGIKVAEEKYGSSAGHYQEKEGPAVARKILEKLNFSEGDIKEICEIIAHHHSPGKINTKNFKVLYEADCIVNSTGYKQKAVAKLFIL